MVYPTDFARALGQAANAPPSTRIAAGARLQDENAGLRSGTLSFVGHATLGDFVGATSAVSGFVVGEMLNARGWVETRVATLATGNALRDRDLRRSMEAVRYPTIRFDLARVIGISSLNEGSHARSLLLVGGLLTIHGVARLVEVPVTVTRTADAIDARARFPLDLADYGVGKLTRLFGLLRMERRIDVSADLRFASRFSRVHR